MATTLELAQHPELFVKIPLTSTVAQALAMLQGSGAAFAVLTGATNADSPQALVVEEQLASLTGEQDAPLSSVLNHFPALISVDGAMKVLDVEALKLLAYWFRQTKAPGLIVYENNQVVEVVSRRTISRALPLSSIPPSNTKRLYGDAIIPARAYICHKCEKEDPPAPLRLPREGEAPICPKHWLHGPMTPLKRGE